MIRAVSGRVTLPQSTPANNLAYFPGREPAGSGAICWTIIKYDGVVECCSYPGEALPVCLYISSYPTTSDPVVIGPDGFTIVGTRAQRTRLGSATLVGRGTPTVAGADVVVPRVEASTSTTRIGGGDRNVSGSSFKPITLGEPVR